MEVIMVAEPSTKEIKVYGYRWVVLLAFMFVSLTMQIFWICYAPVTGVAAERYGVTDLQIGLLAMLFMYIYIPLAIPASWAIDTWGFKKAVGLGAVLMAVFGMMRAFNTTSYEMALIATVGIAVAQPLFLNAGTKVAAKWFPLQERATVIGLGTVAPFLGIVIGQMLTPSLVTNYGFESMLMIYGVAGAISSVFFLVLAREDPPTPAGYEERVLMLDGLKHIFKLKDFYLLAFIMFITGTVFNGVSTWVEVIVRPKGFDINQAGTVGGMLLLGGILGVFILPPISDRRHKRKAVFLFGLVLAIPFLLGLTLLNNYLGVLVSTFILGIFMMGVSPVAMQYATEICYPAPEGTSMGMFTLAGQLSVLLITAMGWSNEVLGSFVPSLLILAGLMVVSVFMLSMMKESKMMLQAAGEAPTEVPSETTL
jgi:MFS family permease